MRNSNNGLISNPGKSSDPISGLVQLVGNDELSSGGCINSDGLDFKHCNLHLGHQQQTTVHATEEESSRV